MDAAAEMILTDRGEVGEEGAGGGVAVKNTKERATSGYRGARCGGREGASDARGEEGGGEDEADEEGQGAAGVKGPGDGEPHGQGRWDEAQVRAAALGDGFRGVRVEEGCVVGGVASFSGGGAGCWAWG